jgi:hypothetical protein
MRSRVPEGSVEYIGFGKGEYVEKKAGVNAKR